MALIKDQTSDKVWLDCYRKRAAFYVNGYRILCLLTVHPGMIFVNKKKLTPNFFLVCFISILYMFRTAMCPSTGELLYQCDTWFMSLCVGAYAPAYQTVIYTESHKPGVALIH